MKGKWTSALVDIDRATEFTGDDVDRYSELVDLGANFDKVLVILPALTSAVVSLYIQKDGNEDTIPVQLQALDDDATGHFAHATTAGTGAIAVLFKLVGGIQYLRVHCGDNQAADRTFWLRGSN